jgi:hypothetical protein
MTTAVYLLFALVALAVGIAVLLAIYLEGR